VSNVLSKRAICAFAVCLPFVFGLIGEARAQGSEVAPSPSPSPSPVPPQESAVAVRESPEVSGAGWQRKGLGLKNGRFKIDLAGYAQMDFRHFDWNVEPDSVRAERELRRLRIGIKAEFDRWSLELDGDPRGSKKGDRLKDAAVGYQFSRKATLLAGHFKPDVSPEFLTSSSRTDLIDRSMAPERLGVDREWGASLSGEASKFTYVAGAFAGDGSPSSERSDAAVASRVTWEPRGGFVLGSSFMQGKVTPDPAVGSIEPEAKGGSGRTSSGFDFSDRPHVKGTRRRVGADAAYSRGSFRAIAEFLQMTEQRLGQGPGGETLPAFRGRAWSLHATYILTGEKKSTKVRPAASIFKGGKGMLEVAARIEGLHFDDTGAETGRAGYRSRDQDLVAAGAATWSAGVNYWASSFLKFQGNALWERYRDATRAPTPGNNGRYFSVVGRIQVMVP